MRYCWLQLLVHAALVCLLLARNVSAFVASSSSFSGIIQTTDQPDCSRQAPSASGRIGQQLRRRSSVSFWTSLSSQSSNENSATTTTTTTTTRCWTREQLEEYASQQGVVLSLTTLGPGYRALARSKHNTTQIMGYVEGFVRPTGRLLHLDKMEVFRKITKQARAKNPEEFKGGGTVLGVGLLLGYLCLLHGQEQGCTTAEFLAIDDEDFQHKRLVRYYRQAGFDLIKYVGDDLASIPDRLVWGGCGTLLRKDIPFLLQKWTRIMERSVEER